jgi:hypothetical protein
LRDAEFCIQYIVANQQILEDNPCIESPKLH